MEVDESGLIGSRLRLVRKERRKGLRVISGLAGMSKAHLSRIERGERSPTIKELYALADALQISVPELTRLPLPAPANGHTDSTIKEIGLALDAIETSHPYGVVLPLDVLRDQVAEIHRQRRTCQFAEVATELPGLIRNLHTTLGAGTEHGDLLDLAVRLHVHVTRLWLVYAGAENHMVRRVVFLARRLAQERNKLTTLAVASFGVAEALLTGEALKQGQIELDSITLPSTTADTAGLIGALHTTHAMAAVLSGHPGDADGALNTATELAERFGATGEVDSLGIVFGPAQAGLCRIWHALEAGDPDRAVRIAQNVQPAAERHPFKEIRAWYWVDYGRALAQLPHRRNDAVMALRAAEQIFPTKVLRDPMVRNTLAGLMNSSIRGSAGEELREMASRAGLPV